MSYLQQITTAANTRPPAIFVYGDPGVGKTTFGAGIPKRVFLIDPMEQGIHTLKQNRLVDSDVPVLPVPETWEQVLAIIDELAEGEHDFACLVIDTLQGLVDLAIDYVIRTQFKGSREAYDAFSKGKSERLPEAFRLFLAALDKCRDRGMRIVLLGHGKDATENRPNAEPHKRTRPDVVPSVWAVVERWCDMILFASTHVEVDKQTKRARGGVQRFFYTGDSAQYVAKNRHKLPIKISMNGDGTAWENLKNSIGKG